MNALSNLFSLLFSTDSFMPHGYCLLWQPELVWLHIISDLSITIAYYSIPVTMFYLLHKRRQQIPFRWIFVMFAIFILLCGSTHLVEIVTLWYPVYVLQGVLKVLTAAASLATALLMFPLVPVLLEKLEQIERLKKDPATAEEDVSKPM